MAERYRQQTLYAPQISVNSQFGQEKVSRALDTAYKVQSEANQVLAEGLRKGAQGIDVFRAQKEIEDFFVTLVYLLYTMKILEQLVVL